MKKEITVGLIPDTPQSLNYDLLLIIIILIIYV